MEIKYDSLKVGQEFKNYKALCEYIGDKQKTGKGKQLQFKEWERYFKWINPIDSKTGKKTHRFTIIEVYDKPIEKVDKRKDNTFTQRWEKPSFFNKNEDLTTTIMLLLIASADLEDLNNSQRVAFKTQQFYQEIGLCNNNYHTLAELQGYYEEILPKRVVSYIFQDTRKKMEKFSMTALKQMEKQKIIDFNLGKLWFENILDDNDRSVLIEHIATPEERGRFLEGVNEAYKVWNTFHDKDEQLNSVSSIYTALNKEERREVFEYAKNYIKRYIPNYEFNCSCYDITFVPQVILCELVSRGLCRDELFELNALCRGNINLRMENVKSLHKKIEPEHHNKVNSKFLDYNINRIFDKFDSDYEKWRDLVTPRKGLYFVDEESLRREKELDKLYRPFTTQEDCYKAINITSATLKLEPSKNEQHLVDKCYYLSLHEINRREEE